METAHFYVIGRVQGVGYRAWAVRTAQKLGISGWVRNRINGAVEIYAQGDSTTLDTFRKMCLEGPLWCRVQRLEAIASPDAPLIPISDDIFEQKPTV